MLGLSEDTEEPVPSLEPVQLLLIGDRDDDARIIVGELTAVGFDPRWLRATTAAELRAAIAGGGCDLVITGHAMAAIDSIEVLAVVGECRVDLPVILLAGRIGEEAVAAAMRGGALDYVNLDNPARLGPAVRRCLAEAAIRVQQRANEAALRESDAQLDEVHPIAEFGSWDWDIATNRVNWSHGLARVYGFEPGHVDSSAVKFLERIHEDDRSDVLAALEGAQASGEPFKLDFRIVRPDGEIRELWCRGAIVHDADAQTVGIQGTAQDVTDLKQAERLASGLLESAPDGIVVVDEAGAIALVNAKLEQLLGYQREELVGAPVKRLIPERFHGQLADGMKRFWERRVDEPAAGSQEIRALTRDGRELPVEATFGSLVGPAGGLIFAALRDITVRKAAEESLRSVNARLQAIFDHVPAGLALRGLDGRYLQINESAARVLGATPRQLVGAPAVEFDPELTALLRRQDEAIIGTGEPQTLDLVRPHEDGTDHEYRVVRYPVRDEQRGLIAFGTFTLDITHRVRAERQTQRALDDLLEAQRIAKLGSWGWDPATQTVTWSAEMYRIYGRDPAEGPAPDERYYGDVVAADRELMRTSHKRLFAIGQPFEIDYRILAGDGIERTVHALGRIDSDRPGVFCGTVQDVTELRAAEDELREAQERLRRAFEHAPIGMVVADLQTRILQVNPAFCAITGYSAAELVGTSFHRLTHPDDIADDNQLVEALRSGEIESYQRETRYLRASGEPVWVSINGTLVRDSDGEPMQLLAQVVDVTERRTLERQLRHLADHDHLTGLLNRRGLEAELEQHVAHVARYGDRGALLVLDLDHFKVVNDTMGHSAGDQVIVSVAGLLIRRMRASDTIARVGGDEFAILLPQADAESAQRVADMIVSDIRQNVVVVESGMPGRVTASVGVTLFNRDHTSVDDVLVNADLAMYDAKEAGRDRTAVHVVDDESESRMRARSELDPADPLGDRGGAIHVRRPADRGSAHRRVPPVRVAVADARRRRGERPAGRLPLDRRALRPDRTARPMGRRQGDLGRRGAARGRRGRDRGGQPLGQVARRRRAARGDRVRAGALGDPADLDDVRGDRDGGCCEHRPRQPFRAAADRTRLPLRARRLWRRLRKLLLPEAHPVRLPEDRRGVRHQLHRQPHRSARDRLARVNRPRPGQADDRRVRRGRADPAIPPEPRGRLRAGLPYRPADADRAGPEGLWR